MSPRVRHYTALYCEENVWQLIDDPVLVDAGHRPHRVVFVSNPHRRVALWSQSAATEATAPVIWDYHVLLVARDAQGAAQVWDLDHAHGYPSPASRWLRQSCAPALHPDFPPTFAPRFRSYDSAVFRARFVSDRSHMRGPDGAFRAPPPRWPAPASRHPEAFTLAAALAFDEPSHPWLSLPAFAHSLGVDPSAPGDAPSS